MVTDWRICATRALVGVVIRESAVSIDEVVDVEEDVPEYEGIEQTGVVYEELPKRPIRILPQNGSSLVRVML